MPYRWPFCEMSDLRTDLLKLAQEDPRVARELVAAMPALMRQLEKDKAKSNKKPEGEKAKAKAPRSERPRSDIEDLQSKIDEAMKSKPKKRKFEEYKEEHPKTKMTFMDWLKSKFKSAAFNQSVLKVAQESPEFRQALARELHQKEEHHGM